MLWSILFKTTILDFRAPFAFFSKTIDQCSFKGNPESLPCENTA